MHSRSVVLVAASLVTIAIAATACGDGGSKPKIRSFTATPATVPSLGGDVTLVWDVARADEIEITPGVGVVTGTAATVHVTETTTFTLVAKKNGRFDRSRETVTVAGASAVTGTVRLALSQAPLANVLVWIKGKGATYTDENGQFTFDDVETPYDIAVVDQPFGGLVTIVWMGVTRFDPILEVNQIATPPPQYFANFSGNMLPAAPGGTQTRLFFDTNLFAPSGITVSDAWGTFGAGWYGDENYDVTLHGLRFTLDTAGNVATYTGYGSTVVTATNGASHVADVTLAATTTDLTSGTIDVPSTAVVNDVEGFMIFGVPTGSFEDEGFFLPPEGTNMTDEHAFEVPSPAIPGTVFGLRAQIIDPAFGGTALAYTGAIPGTSNIEIDLPAAPRLLLPVANAVIDRDTTFQIAGRDDSLKVYEFSASPFPPLQLMVITTENSFQLPDTREIGFDIFSFSTINWRVYAEVAPQGSIDDALGATGIAGTEPAWYAQTPALAVHPSTSVVLP